MRQVDCATKHSVSAVSDAFEAPTTAASLFQHFAALHHLAKVGNDVVILFQCHGCAPVVLTESDLRQVQTVDPGDLAEGVGSVEDHHETDRTP